MLSHITEDFDVPVCGAAFCNAIRFLGGLGLSDYLNIVE